MNDNPSEGIVVSATFRLLLNRAKDKKLRLLKQSLAEIGEVEQCEVELKFYRSFNSKGYRIGRKTYVPSNGTGIAKLVIHTVYGIEIPFHVVCRFSEIALFLSEAVPYMKDSEFRKSFYIEQSETLQNYIVINVNLAT